MTSRSSSKTLLVLGLVAVGVFTAMSAVLHGDTELFAAAMVFLAFAIGLLWVSA